MTPVGGGRYEILMTGGRRRLRADLELELVLRMNRVVDLRAQRIELPILREIVRIGIGKERERRRIDLARDVIETSVAIKERSEEVGILRLACSLAGGTELMSPPEIREGVDVRLMIVVDRVTRRVERYLETRARRVEIEAHHVVRARRELDLAKAEVVGALIMKVHNFRRRRIEDHRLEAHAAELARSREEEAPWTGIRAEAQ